MQGYQPEADPVVMESRASPVPVVKATPPTATTLPSTSDAVATSTATETATTTISVTSVVTSSVDVGAHRQPGLFESPLVVQGKRARKPSHRLIEKFADEDVVSLSRMLSIYHVQCHLNPHSYHEEKKQAML